MSTCSKGNDARVLPFRSAADAWFWTMGALQARREGSGNSGSAVKRPCDPDDVVCCLDRLYRSRQIELRHARVLRDWGERQLAPDARSGSGREALLWGEALRRLEPPLRKKGIVL
jgi:hypothetical protein